MKEAVFEYDVKSRKQGICIDFSSHDILVHMENMSETKSKAVEIIRDYMGESTAQAYAGFYATQDDAMVLASVRELMREYVGAGQADEIFRKNGLGQ